MWATGSQKHVLPGGAVVTRRHRQFSEEQLPVLDAEHERDVLQLQAKRSLLQSLWPKNAVASSANLAHFGQLWKIGLNRAHLRRPIGVQHSLGKRLRELESEPPAGQRKPDDEFLRQLRLDCSVFWRGKQSNSESFKCKWLNSLRRRQPIRFLKV